VPLVRPALGDCEAFAFTELLDLVFATANGGGEDWRAFAGLLALALAFSMGAGDLLAWRVGAFAGLLDRLLRPVPVGCAFAISAGLRDLVLSLSIGAGDLDVVRVAAFFGLWL
jgi:hypothetical protein